MANCTIAGNRSRFNQAVFAAGGTILNTIIAGNIATEIEGTSIWGGGASTNIFSYCVTDNEEKINPTCRVGTANVIFENFAAGDYRLGYSSPAINIGPKLTAQKAAAAGFDLLGRPRVIDYRVDAGCYERKGRTTTVIVR